MKVILMKLLSLEQLSYNVIVRVYLQEFILRNLVCKAATLPITTFGSHRYFQASIILNATNREIMEYKIM